jgi:hypothetical protein
VACVKPAFDYFVSKFEHELKPVVDAFKAAQLFWPHKVNDLSPDSSSVDSLKAFPFYQDSTLFNHLKVELPCYLSTSADLGQHVDPLDWWKCQSKTLPRLVSCCFNHTTGTALFGSSGVYFLVAKCSFGDQQDTTLQDYIETSTYAMV